MERELRPCPFCGGMDTLIDEKRLSPRMDRPGAVISVTIKHWCPPEEGQPHQYLSRTGRDKESAIRFWNMRSAVDT